MTQLITQNLHFVPVKAPTTDPATFYTAGINMGKCVAVQFIISAGTLGTADYTFTVGSSAAAGSSSPTKDMAFRYRKSVAAGTDTMGDITNVALATGVALTYTTDSNKSILIDVAPEELEQGYPFLQITATRGSSATAVGLCINAIVKPRYPQNSSKDGSGTSYFA